MKEYISKNNLIAILSLASFNFLFLGTEYLFDDIMAFFVSPSSVVNFQNIILGASVIGYLLYGLLDNKMIHIGHYRFLKLMLASLLSAFIILISLHLSELFVLATGILAFIILGLIGSEVCYRASHSISDLTILSRIVGISYAIGIAIQFLNNNLVKNNIIQGIILSIFALLLSVVCLRPITSEDSIIKGKVRSADFANKKTALLVLLVVLMTCIFSTLDNAVTLVHTSGDFNIGQWPRLLLAVSGLGAGFLFDINGRKYINFIMYGVTLVSSICVILLTSGVSFIVGLLFFYFSAGFFVVYFMTVFMEHSFNTNMPKLWAGIGRGINNATAIVISSLSVFLIGKSGIVILIIDLILFATISLIMFLLYDISRKKQIDRFLEEYTGTVDVLHDVGAKGDEERFAEFSVKYGLTEREEEVLRELLSSEDNVQEIASALYISRAVLYRHISSINEKTNTKSRIGIIKKYYSEINQ